MFSALLNRFNKTRNIFLKYKALLALISGFSSYFLSKSFIHSIIIHQSFNNLVDITMHSFLVIIALTSLVLFLALYIYDNKRFIYYRFFVLWDKNLHPHCYTHRTPLIMPVPAHVKVDYAPYKSGAYCKKCDAIHAFIENNTLYTAYECQKMLKSS